MESFAQVSAQRKLQAEREARARQRREEEEERARKKRMAAFAQEQQEKADWWKWKMEEGARKSAGATSDGEARRVSSDGEGGGGVTSARE